MTKQIQATILADSINDRGERITSMEMILPRFELASLNTYRVFSRNGASSRARPVQKVLDQIKNDPFVPIFWGKNQPGMYAEEEVDWITQRSAKIEWLEAAHDAILHAEKLMFMGVHKELCSRLVEPFMWQTDIVTATSYDNFLEQRLPGGGAQKEISVLAGSVRDALAASTPVKLGKDEWHVPFPYPSEDLYDGLRRAVAACARISYENHHGLKSLEDDVRLFKQLKESGHWSPFEHIATPYGYGHYEANFNGWVPLRHHPILESL